MLLLLALALSGTARALSSWYTPPGGPPTGSNPGDKIRGVNLGGWFILVSRHVGETTGSSWLPQYLLTVCPTGKLDDARLLRCLTPGSAFHLGRGGLTLLHIAQLTDEGDSGRTARY